jgi:hypothetical protein
MLVTITEKCSRCKREAPKQIDSTEVPAFEAAEQVRATVRSGIENYFTNPASEGVKPQRDMLPDLVVVFKGEVQTTDRLCTMCQQTVANQVKAMFRPIDPTKRAPRKTRTAEETPVEAATATETPAETAPAAEGEAKKSKKK